MTDKELLELAAKAAGIEYEEINKMGCRLTTTDEDGFRHIWNPLTDDGDALRLAVKLKININFLDLSVKWLIIANQSSCDLDHNDHFQYTRRAIVRAAAEIGKTL